MFRFVLPKPAVVMSVVFLAAACQSGEQRAEEFYQNALRLMEAGDFERASVEFRNVFNHNGLHRGAREDFAAMLRREEYIWESYSQYLRLVEQYPDHVEGLTALSEMAIGYQDWEELERHGTRVINLAPEALESRVIVANLDYLNALEAEDEPARRAVYDRVLALLQEDPENPFLLPLQADSLERDGDLEAALAALDQALAVDPYNWALHDMRLRLLAGLERGPELAAQLAHMIEIFPDDETLPGALLRYYVATGETDAAKDFLRNRAADAETPEGRQDALVALVRLINEVDGRDAALAELDTIIATDPEAPISLSTLRAGLRFDAGQLDDAIAELNDLLAGELSVEDSGQIRVALAQMLLARGDEAQARQLIDAVLEEDSGQVEALKMLSAWLIEEDEADRAISRLRTALEGNPDDAEALTLMASAHARNGNRQLAREFLSLAVEASGAAPAETLRYAAVLIEDERFLLAEELMVDALRLAPRHPDLLAQLGDLYLRLEDWARVEQVERTLRDIATPQTFAQADGLWTAMLARRGETDEALTFLEDLAASDGGGNLNTQIALVRARLSLGETESALNLARELLAEAPEDPARRQTLAAVYSAVGDYDAAEPLYRDLVADTPQILEGWIGLFRTLTAKQEPEAALEVLNDALQVFPEAPDLLWIQASMAERNGDFEGAIGIYERLYDVLPNSPVVANNLASLISTYRSDEESLVRAYGIARRLRGSAVPQFQDTYGWIAYRRGDHQEAVDHLEPAAAALPDDPLVQFHLGMAYLAVGRADQALETLRQAVDLAGPDDSRQQFEIARSEIATLEAAAAAAEGAEESE